MKDYANIKKATAASKQPTRWPAFIALTLVALALSGVLIVQVHHFSQQRAAKANKTKRVTTSITPKTSAKKTPATQFEFYTLLSKQAVPQPIAHTSQTESNQPINHASKTFYQLQAASLQNRIDAQAFARQLLSLGYQSKIQAYLHGDGATWYRVVIGPIDNMASARQAQAKLQQHHIDSLLSRIR